MEHWMVEYTDTFGGEPNYSWVKRLEFALPVGASQKKIIQTAKYKLGLTGVKGRTFDLGDCFSFHPYGMATVMFVELSDG